MAAVASQAPNHCSTETRFWSGLRIAKNPHCSLPHQQRQLFETQGGVLLGLVGSLVPLEHGSLMMVNVEPVHPEQLRLAVETCDWVQQNCRAHPDTLRADYERLIYYFLAEVAEAMIDDGSRHRSFEPLTVDEAGERNAVDSPATTRNWILSIDSAPAVLPERML